MSGEHGLLPPQLDVAHDEPPYELMHSAVTGRSLAIKSSVRSSACCAAAGATADSLADAVAAVGVLLVSAGLCYSCGCLLRRDGSLAMVAAAAAFSAAASLRTGRAMKMQGADMSMYIKNLRNIPYAQHISDAAFMRAD
jgi:hypothetical protein